MFRSIQPSGLHREERGESGEESGRGRWIALDGARALREHGHVLAEHGHGLRKHGYALREHGYEREDNYGRDAGFDWPVTIGTYPTSSPAGGVTSRPGSSETSFPRVGGGM